MIVAGEKLLKNWKATSFRFILVKSKDRVEVLMFAIEGEEEREFDRMAGRTFSEALWELEKKVWNMSWDKTKGLS